MNREFILFEYEEEGTYGIAIQKDAIEVGNPYNFEEYEVIEYDDNVRMVNDSSEYHAIALKTSLEYDFAEELRKLMQIALDELIVNREECSFSIVVNKLSSIFKKIAKEANRMEYIGLMSELAFIKRCELIQIDVTPYYQLGLTDTIDFHFPNNIGVEIKTINKDSKSIIVSDKQLDKVLNSSDRFLAADLDINSSEGLNLEELFNTIYSDNWPSRLKVKEKILSLKSSSMNLFNEYKINLDGTTFIWVDKQYLPVVSIRNYYDENSNKHSTSLISAKFKLFVSENIKEKDFNTLVKDLVNGYEK